MKNEYPKWLYHRTESARIVRDPAEHQALAAAGYMTADELAAPAPPQVEASRKGKQKR